MRFCPHHSGHRSTSLIALATAVVLLTSATTTALAQESAGIPKISDELIARGKMVYLGGPSCVTCHGIGGKGTARGPDLTDTTWIHGTGSYEDIVKLVTHGVPKTESVTGQEMPIRGWAHSASDDDIRVVAAYVWSLSHAAR